MPRREKATRMARTFILSVGAGLRGKSIATAPFYLADFYLRRLHNKILVVLLSSNFGKPSHMYIISLFFNIVQGWGWVGGWEI